MRSILFPIALVALFVGFLVVCFLIARSSRRRRRKALLMLGSFVLLIVCLLVVGRLWMPSDEERIQATIEAVFTKSYPSYCDEKVTDHYLEREFDEQQPFADDRCRAESGQGGADSIEVTEIDVRGHHAFAAVSPRGGSLDGSQIEVELVEDGVRWKLQQIYEVLRLDRPSFNRQLAQQIRELGSPGKSVECVRRRAAGLSTVRVEQMIVGAGDGSMTAAYVDCDREGAERAGLGAIASFKLGAPATRCVEHGIETANDAELVRLFRDFAAYGAFIARCDPEVIVDYVEQELIGQNKDPAPVRCVVEAFRGLSPARQWRLSYDEERFSALRERCGI